MLSSIRSNRASRKGRLDQSAAKAVDFSFITQPCDDFFSVLIDVCHYRHLMIPLLDDFLLDTYLVNSNPVLHRPARSNFEEVIEVLSDSEPLHIEYDMKREVRWSPSI